MDLDELTEKIWRDLQGQVDQSKIRQVLVDLKPKYQRGFHLNLYPDLYAAKMKLRSWAAVLNEIRTMLVQTGMVLKNKLDERY